MQLTEKLDLARERATNFKANSEPALVEIPPAVYLAASGSGSPDDPAFAAAIGALYTCAYTIKMAAKKRGQDFRVSNLEGLFWPDEVFTDEAEWWVTAQQMCWQLMIMVPDFITEPDLAAAQAAFHPRAGDQTSRPAVSLTTLSEGLSAQVLHVGPYAEEAPTISRLHAFIRERGLRPTGKHHEVYLSDPRRTAPARLRTIIRQPVRP